MPSTAVGTGLVAAVTVQCGKRTCGSCCQWVLHCTSTSVGVRDTASQKAYFSAGSISACFDESLSRDRTAANIDLMGSYLSYLHRRNVDTGTAPEPRLPPNVIRNTALSAAGFAAVNLALPHLLPRLLPGFDKFDADTQRQFVYYVSSCCHHLVVAPWCAYIRESMDWSPPSLETPRHAVVDAVFRQWRESAAATEETVVDYSAASRHMIPFTSGYFITGKRRALLLSATVTCIASHRLCVLDRLPVHSSRCGLTAGV